jgi:hypothetical protein
MTDANSGSATPQQIATHPPFPGVRLLWSIGFGVLAWIVFWVLVVLGVVQFVLLAVNGQVNDELKRFSRNLVQYLFELLAYVLMLRDEQPFPIGPFPSVVA